MAPGNDNNDAPPPSAPLLPPSSSTRLPRPPIIGSAPRAGSFRAGSPLPTTLTTANRRRLTEAFRRVSTAGSYHYQTFPTPAPKSAGRRRRSEASPTPSDDGDNDESTPLPIKQLALLALLSLAEQSALNSISPYLPEMVESFPGVAPEEVGLYVGLLASSFALAQLATNLFWGYLSDVVGRKPILLVGTSLLCVCFCLFGFCTRYYQIILVHIAMGLLNGNATVVPTCLGELTDRSNQSRAFTWLPVVYSLGSITGPALGGLLVATLAKDQYPFLAPNILAAALLAVSVIVLAIWFDETLEDKQELPSWSEWLPFLRCCLGREKRGSGGVQSWTWPGGRDTDAATDEHDNDLGNREDTGLLQPRSDESGDDDAKQPSSHNSTWRQLMNRTTIVLLATSLIFQLSNSSFNSLYPIFASGHEPTGRNLQPGFIGISLSIAGIFTIFFQLFVFGSLKSKLGNVGTYRGSLFGFTATMTLMPFVGYKGDGDEKRMETIWLYIELVVILAVKNICSVGGLSSVLLLITNSAPSHATLGTLNGVAQTLSAAGRSIGPFLSGSIYTASTKVKSPKGEALAWGLFAGIALVGWGATYAIRGEGLESTDDGYEAAEEGQDHRSDAP
ncbi:MFS general substrate transporter [Xylariaceae sp. FL0255]|nr:MFS general substrate transporter [Xylariaceae sp. FL0255]